MKKIFSSINETMFGLELLSEREMLNVRGGWIDQKPRSRPKDEYDYSEEEA